MAEFVVPTPPRRRGRPRGGASGARERIVEASVAEFEDRRRGVVLLRCAVGNTLATPLLEFLA